MIVVRESSVSDTPGIPWQLEGARLRPGSRFADEHDAKHYHVSSMQCSRLRVYCVLGFLVSWIGCSPAYVTRAGLEQARIVWTRQPISELLASPELSTEDRHRLELVREVRTFADRHVGLRVGGNYSTVVPSRSTAALHVVTAAERFRLEPVSWWFPIVGRVPYKGYFDRERAAAAAARLERGGFDTRIFAAPAFSTLGWFDDPLFSNLLRLPDEVLANLILHELLHTTYFTPGHIAFAESFASFVGYRGAVEFFAHRGELDRAASIEREWDAAIAFSEFLHNELDLLAGDYARGMNEEARQARFRRIRNRWANQSGSEVYAGFGPEPINNATLLHLSVYHRKLGVFEQAWKRHGSDLRKTVDAIITATKEQRGTLDPYLVLDGLVQPERLTLGEDQRPTSDASPR